MTSNADVRSLAGLETFLGQLEHFRVQLLKEIENLELEVRRLTAWLENDAVGYWMDEMKAAQRRFVDATDNLSRCMSYVRSSERRPCTEEKKRVLKAKLRRETCELKLKIVRAAVIHWERERTKNQARIERCRDMADSDLLVAINHLRGQLGRLEDYANVKSAATSQRPATATSAFGAESEQVATPPQADPPEDPAEDPAQQKQNGESS